VHFILAGRLEDQGARMRARHAAILEGVAEEAMAAWRRSSQGSTTLKVVTRQAGTGGEPAEVFASKEERASAGNPAFLGIVVKALADARKILGCDAPGEPAPGRFVHDEVLDDLQGRLKR